MHLPVEVSVVGSVDYDLFVDVLHMICACLVVINSNIDIVHKGVEIFLVLVCHLRVCGISFLEPSDNFILVEIKGEGVVLYVNPII